MKIQSGRDRRFFPGLLGGPGIGYFQDYAAVQQLKGKFWMPVSRLLRLCCMGLWDERLGPGINGAFIHEVKDVLGKFGVRLCQLTNFNACVTRGEEIVDLAKNTPAGSVILFSVEWVTQTGKGAAHALVAWKDPQGTVYIIDRTAEATGKLVKSLAELDALYPNSGYTGIANSVLQDAYRLENCSGGFVRQGGRLLFALGFTTTLAVQSLEAQKTDQQR